MRADVVALAGQQGGVLTREQLRALGVSEQEIRTVLARSWQRVHPGTYLLHTGTPSWLERASAACRAAWPAMLCRTSALPFLFPPSVTGQIHVAVLSGRRVRKLQGVTVHELLTFESRFRAFGSPPRDRVEEAVLDLLRAARTEWDEVTLLARAIQSGNTSAARLRAALDRRLRVRRREEVRELLDDIERGTHSALERAFEKRVVIPHGLPRGTLQRVARSGGREVHRDVEFEGLHVLVELDGWSFHADVAVRDRDLLRDLTSSADGLTTIRLGWGQVVKDSCRTAHLLGQVLRRHGWSGHAYACASCPLEFRM